MKEGQKAMMNVPPAENKSGFKSALEVDSSREPIDVTASEKVTAEESPSRLRKWLGIAISLSVLVHCEV